MPAQVRPVSHTRITAEQGRGIEKLKRRPPSGPIENVNVVSSSGSTETLPDVDVATMHRVTLTANCALTVPAAGAGKSFSLWLVQDGTGSWTVTWDAAADWGGGTAPTLSTGAGKVDVFGWACSDGSTWTNLGYVLDSR